MSKYKVERSATFTAKLKEIESRFPGAEDSVRVAERYLCSHAELCGISTNRAQSYFLTRQTAEVPVLAIFFQLLEVEQRVNLTTVSVTSFDMD
jgi:hypothetical protein